MKLSSVSGDLAAALYLPPSAAARLVPVRIPAGSHPREGMSMLRAIVRLTAFVAAILLPRSVVLSTVLLAGGGASANMILNGDFENHSAPSSPQFNLSNAAFTGMVADATAFGDSQEIDLTKTGNGWGIDPQSGDWKLGLHTRLVGFYDAFSSTLSTPIVSGQIYQLEFFAARYPSSPPAAIQIGLSSSASIFGTLLTSGFATSSASWSQFDSSFVAPIGANFLTVRSDPAVLDGYTFVDNMSLVAIPEPTHLTLMSLGLAGFGFARRRRSTRQRFRHPQA